LLQGSKTVAPNISQSGFLAILAAALLFKTARKAVADFMIPHVVARKTHQLLRENSFVTSKRVLQQYRHQADVGVSLNVRFAPAIHE
jgi:hypothetical protein